MPDRKELSAAVEADILSAVQADALHAFLEARAPIQATSQEPRDAEELHFVRGLHDILIALGLVLFLVGLVALFPPWSYLLGATVSWALAEYFVARNRLVLPGIMLASAFALLAAFSAGALLLSLPPTVTSEVFSGLQTEHLAGVTFAAGGFVAALAFYVRFRLPFSLALVVICLIGVVISMIEIGSPGFVWAHTGAFTLALGLLIFAAAMREDLLDPKRETLHADNAFWLHLLSAPAIVHGLIGHELGAGAAGGIGGALMVVGTMGFVTIVALLIDRRALLVAGLGYFAAALGTLVQSLVASGGTLAGLTLTPLLVGAIVLMIGVGWSRFRRTLLPLLPTSLSKRIHQA